MSRGGDPAYLCYHRWSFDKREKNEEAVEGIGSRKYLAGYLASAGTEGESLAFITRLGLIRERPLACLARRQGVPELPTPGYAEQINHTGQFLYAQGYFNNWKIYISSIWNLFLFREEKRRLNRKIEIIGLSDEINPGFFNLFPRQKFNEYSLNPGWGNLRP